MIIVTLSMFTDQLHANLSQIVVNRKMKNHFVLAKIGSNNNELHKDKQHITKCAAKSDEKWNAIMKQ